MRSERTNNIIICRWEKLSEVKLLSVPNKDFSLGLEAQTKNPDLKGLGKSRPFTLANSYAAVNQRYNKSAVSHGTAAALSARPAFYS